MRDIVIYNRELKIQHNEIDTYILFLIAKCDNFINVVAELENDDKMDNSLTDKLVEYTKCVKEYKKHLNNIQANIKEYLELYLDEIDEADDFKFNDSIITRLSDFLENIF